MTTPPDDQVARMHGWAGGMNNRIRETESGPRREGEAFPTSQFLRRALNVDLTTEGLPLRRRGYVRVVEGYAHSLWWCREFALLLAVVDGELRVGRSLDTLTARASVNRYLRMSMVHHVDAVYWSNGKESGLIDSAGEAGVWPHPQWAQNLNTRDDFTPIDFEALPDKQGQQLVDGPLYAPMPVGQLVESFSGRLWVAQDSTLYFSEPMQPHVVRTATNFFMRPRDIRMLAHAHDGLYVGDDEGVWFLLGTDPYALSVRHVSPYGVVNKAVTRVPGEKFEVSVDDVPVWWGKDGVLMAGFPGGDVRQLTRDRLATAEFASGALSVREREGISQIVASLQKGGGVTTMAATDSVVADVRRSGITGVS